MNKESKKLTWAVGLVAGLGVLSIAYAALSSTLNIKGENASVNVGYVRFLDKGEQSDKGCEALGIGSTNTEYHDSENSTTSGGLFDTRSDSNKPGLILSDGFLVPLTKSLAETGTLKVETEGGTVKKAKDTVTIKDAKLNDYGSFIIYKLDIINESANPMRLKSEPTVVVTDVAASGSGTAASSDNIETAIYTDYAKANFSEPCKTPLAATTESSGTISGQSEFNYLGAGDVTTWYLRVGFKNYDAAKNNVHGSTTFTFSVTPVWEAVIPKA